MFQLLCIPLLVGIVAGHGRLREPPSRASMWRDGFRTKPDWYDDEAFCGGLEHQWDVLGGKCGVCGDPWDQTKPRKHELGGKFGKGIITRTYKKGQTIDTYVQVTTNHRGWFEYRVCPMTNPGPGNDATQECLNQHVLQLADGSGTRLHIDGNQMDFHIKLKLPDGLTCEHCLLQWHWTCGDTWDICPDGRGRDGCGPQETFRGCADIRIQ